MIDAHHHLWDLTKVTYPWLEAKGTERFFGQPDQIRKNYLPADYFHDHTGMITKSVHIQVGCIPEHNLKETALIESFINDDAPIAAIVAAVNVRSSNLHEQLRSQLTFPHVKGVRHMIGKSPTENHQLPKFVGAEWIEGWKLIAEQGLTFDLQCTAEQYQSVYEALCQVPELNVAICHFASPWQQDDVGFSEWLFWMKKFAKLPNCYIKLSGFSMFTQSFNLNNFLMYSKAAITLFGANRCMLGSNFPVDKLHMSYGELIEAWKTLLNEVGKHEQNWLTTKTAQNFYQL